MDVNKFVIDIIANTVDNCISENILLDYANKYDLDNMDFSILCDELSQKNIEIISEEKFNLLLSQKKKENFFETKYPDILNLFLNLSLQDKKKCLGELSLIVQIDENKQNNKVVNCEIKEKEQSNKIKSLFIKTFEKKSLQYSYIAVLIKAFFKKANEDGIAFLDDLIDYFYNYYSQRKNKGEITEQKDSKLVKNDFSREIIKNVILFNPLKRSFLCDYMKYDKQIKSVIINQSLWNELTENDKKHIEKIAYEKLDVYYKRISNET